MEHQLYVMPESFKPELLRIMTLKELIQIIHLFGLEAVCERAGHDDVLEIIRRTNGVTNGSIDTRATTNS
jgi:hypothetical protein